MVLRVVFRIRSEYKLSFLLPLSNIVVVVENAPCTANKMDKFRDAVFSCARGEVSSGRYWLICRSPSEANSIGMIFKYENKIPEKSFL